MATAREAAAKSLVSFECVQIYPTLAITNLIIGPRTTASAFADEVRLAC